MSSIRQVSIAAALLAGSALAVSPALAQDQGFHPAAHPHPAPHPAIHRPVPPGTYRMIRPGAGFHRPLGSIARVHPLHTIIAAHVPFARFTPAQRALWTRGHWAHRWWNGRYGWWWNAGGVWFWYGAPVYPYPTVVSDYYYEEPVYNQGGPTWWYCYNPAGYYPYVPSCYTQWTPVPAQGYGPGYEDEQGAPDQGPPPGEGYGSEQGPPPSYGGGQEEPPAGYGQPPDDEQGPPPGYNQGPPPGYDQGPPPEGDQGPPDGYGQRPPSAYNQGPPPDDDNGPPPDDSQPPHSSD